MACSPTYKALRSKYRSCRSKLSKLSKSRSRKSSSRKSCSRKSRSRKSSSRKSRSRKSPSRKSRSRKSSSRKSRSRKYRSRKSRSRKSPVKRHYSIKGLNDWHDHEFRHLGWMVLSKNNRVNDKVKAYKNSVNRLVKAVEQEMKESHSSDRIHDLKILHKNVKVLQKHVGKDF